MRTIHFIFWVFFFCFYDCLHGGATRAVCCWLDPARFSLSLSLFFLWFFYYFHFSGTINIIFSLFVCVRVCFDRAIRMRKKNNNNNNKKLRIVNCVLLLPIALESSIWTNICTHLRLLNIYNNNKKIEKKRERFTYLFLLMLTPNTAKAKQNTWIVY
jgi:hypothetical protein